MISNLLGQAEVTPLGGILVCSGLPLYAQLDAEINALVFQGPDVLRQRCAWSSLLVPSPQMMLVLTFSVSVFT